MSLTHLISTINEKIKSEIQAIQRQALAEKERILKDAETHVKDLKQKKEDELRSKTAEKITKAKRHAQTVLKHKILEKKQHVINTVCEQAGKKLATQEDKLTNLYDSLLARLTPIKNAEIITTPKSAALIRPLLEKHNLPFAIRAELEEEGFIVQSETVEIDHRIRALFEEVKDEIAREVAKKLFSE